MLSMKKILSVLLLFCFLYTPIFAVDFDTSVDESIRKDYKVKESEQTLPALPNVSPSKDDVNIPVKTNLSATGKIYTIKGGTKIILASQKSVNEKYKKGSKIGFATQNNITTKDGTTIPAGTLIKATVTDSHGPQITGNGGLIELCFNEIYFNGVKSELDSKIDKANYKKIYFNDIKGERRYWKNFGKATKPGQKVFKATKKATKAMASIPIINIISFIPILGGSVFYTLNFVTSPVIMVFLKGGHISLPSGTRFEIKIKGDTEIRG